MLNRKTLTAIALVVAGGPALAEDDVNRAQVLLEQARNYGVSEPTGQAAGEVTAPRERRREAQSKQMNANEKAWQAIRPKVN